MSDWLHPKTPEVIEDTPSPFSSMGEEGSKFSAVIRRIWRFEGITPSDLKPATRPIHLALIILLSLWLPLLLFRNWQNPVPWAWVYVAATSSYLIALLLSRKASPPIQLLVSSAIFLLMAIQILIRNDVSPMATAFIAMAAVIMATASANGRVGYAYQAFFIVAILAIGILKTEQPPGYLAFASLMWLLSTNAVLTMMVLIYSSFDDQRNYLRTMTKRQSSMFTIIGHELRTPASAIRMLGDNIGSPETVKKDLIASCEHLLGVIEDLRVAVAPAEDVSTRPRYIKLEDLGHLLTAGIKPVFHKTPMTFDLEVVDDAHALLFLDPVRLVTVLSNLVRNAVKHSGGDRVVVRFHSEPTGNNMLRLTCSVTDNGIGIPPQDVERLFGMFERGNTKAPGVGVGLYLARQWTTIMGGKISCHRATPAGGTTFTVVLEQEFSDTERLLEDEDTYDNKISLSPGLTVLLVEDDALSRRLISATLMEKLGATVTVAKDGQEALDLLEQHHFQLVISDFLMPRMDGLALLQAMRDRGDQTPYIGLTAATLGDDMAKLAEAGAAAVLSKPLKLHELTNTLEALENSGKLTTQKQG